MDKFDGNIADIRFTPYAWQKLLYFLYKGDTEVTGFGESHEDDDSLIVDFRLVKQQCSSVSVNMNKEDIEEYSNKMVDQGYSPNKYLRHWIHTHPNMSARPSSVDVKQFEEFMEIYPWVSMIIVSRNLDTFCRVGFNQGPGANVDLSVGVDWRYPCEDLDFNELDEEYNRCVSEEVRLVRELPTKYQQNYAQIDWSDRWKSDNMNYRNMQSGIVDDDYDFDDDDIKDTGLDAEEFRQCFEEYLAEKSIHEMDDEEFEALEKLTKSTGE